MSAAGLKKGSIDRQWTSAKPPQQVAGCLAANLNGSNPVFQDEEGHFVVIRNNGYGAPAVRYDIYAGRSSTVIELRSAIGINNGAGKLESCL